MFKISTLFSLAIILSFQVASSSSNPEIPLKMISIGEKGDFVPKGEVHTYAFKSELIGKYLYVDGEKNCDKVWEGFLEWINIPLLKGYGMDGSFWVMSACRIYEKGLSIWMEGFLQADTPEKAKILDEHVAKMNEAPPFNFRERFRKPYDVAISLTLQGWKDGTGFRSWSFKDLRDMNLFDYIKIASEYKELMEDDPGTRFPEFAIKLFGKEKAGFFIANVVPKVNSISISAKQIFFMSDIGILNAWPVGWREEYHCSGVGQCLQ